MDFHDPWRRLTSPRFVRGASAFVAVGALLLVLYNATAVDRIPPTVSIKLSSVTKDTNLALTGTSIDVVFSEDVKRDTAQRAFSISPSIPGAFSWQSSRELIFTPSNKLPLAATFKVHVSPGVEDAAGNAQGNSSDLSFTTVSAPIVKAISPQPDAKNVAVDSTIQITFDRLMDVDKVAQGLRIAPPIETKQAWNGQVLTLTPSKPLGFGTTYTITIGDPAVDTDGTKLAAAYASSFTTVGMGLHATDAIPADVAGVSVRTPIAVIFDGPIDPSSVGEALQLTPPVGGNTKVVSLPDDREPVARAAPTQAAAGSALVFTPSQPLAAHTTYTVTLKPVVQRPGGEVAQGRTWSFTTGEPPTTAQNQIVFLSDRGGIRNVWIMNPDGSNPRQVTSELVPVSGYDVSADGSKVVYGVGGVIKRMGIGGGDVTTMTAPNRYEYAASFTPDANAVILGRRDANGADQGYWRVPIVSGADEQQILPAGAPGLGSVALGGDGLTDSAGVPSWAPRAAVTADEKTMLLVRGLDDGVVLMDLTGTKTAQRLNVIAQASPVWVQEDNSFYLVASSDGGASWAAWRISPAGEMTKVDAAVGALAARTGGQLAILRAGDSATHLAFVASGGSTPSVIAGEAGWNERSPSFSPDGTKIVFGRVPAQTPTASGGIWIVKTDGSGMERVATDGVYPRWMP